MQEQKSRETWDGNPNRNATCCFRCRILIVCAWLLRLLFAAAGQLLLLESTLADTAVFVALARFIFWLLLVVLVDYLLLFRLLCLLARHDKTVAASLEMSRSKSRRRQIDRKISCHNVLDHSNSEFPTQHRPSLSIWINHCLKLEITVLIDVIHGVWYMRLNTVYSCF